MLAKFLGVLLHLVVFANVGLVCFYLRPQGSSLSLGVRLCTSGLLQNSDCVLSL